MLTENTRKANQARRFVTAEIYGDQNETINRLIEDDDGILWFVNGSAGRKPVFADTEEEAIEQYLVRFYEEPEEEFV